MTITGKQLIGNTQSGNGTDTFNGPVKNKDGVAYSFHEATIAEIDLAIEKANAAAPVYKRLSYQQRADFLDKIADEIIAIGPLLIETTVKETALPEWRLLAERDRTTNQLRFFANILREGSWLRAIIDLPNPSNPAKSDLRQMQIPLGVAGVFGASNFPYAFSVAGGDTASALAAGCPVVHKAHPAHPVTAELVGQAVIKAAQQTGMPEGVFSMVQGVTYQTGLHIVGHPFVKAVAFTGSYQGGKALFDAANKREEPIPVYSEMGSFNPVFILPGILAEQGTELAKALADSNLLGTGQYCTNPGVMVLPDSADAGQFMNDFKTSVDNASGGTMLSDSIYRSYAKGTEKLAGHKGVEVYGKGTSEHDTAAIPYMFKADADAFFTNEALSEEYFGPASVHVVTKNDDEVYKIARNLRGQITATIWGNEQDLKDYAELRYILEEKVGRILINGTPTGVEVANAMVHGGPFPATTNSATTSVGGTAIYRFTRPVCYQNFPDSSLPEPLQNINPLGILRLVDNDYNRNPIS